MRPMGSPAAELQVKCARGLIGILQVVEYNACYVREAAFVRFTSFSHSATV